MAASKEYILNTKQIKQKKIFNTIQTICRVKSSMKLDEHFISVKSTTDGYIILVTHLPNGNTDKV